MVDAGSTDGTPAVARAHGARVIDHPGATIGAQKNVGIEQARHYWILSIDADERVTPELQAAIAAVIQAPTASAYRVHLRNRYLGDWYDRGGWARDRHVRLFPHTARWTTNRVHERLIGVTEVADLTGRLEHDSYRDLAHQLEKCHTYARWGADDLWTRGVRVNWRHLVLRPAWRFVKTYLLEGMWREGVRGLLFCSVHAWACFTKYALVWDRQRCTPALSLAETASTERAPAWPNPQPDLQPDAAVARQA